MYSPSAEPCGDESLEEATVGGGVWLAGRTPWREVVHDGRSRPAGPIGIGAPSWGIAGEVGIPVHGGYSRVQVWCGHTTSVWSSTGGRKRKHFGIT